MLFQYKIHDNGIGFDTDEARKKGHYGLQNMQHRAAEIGANYNLQTSVQSGTEILISFQAKNTTYA